MCPFSSSKSAVFSTVHTESSLVIDHEIGWRRTEVDSSELGGANISSNGKTVNSRVLVKVERLFFVVKLASFIRSRNVWRFSFALA